jgi:hypothetical protein
VGGQRLEGLGFEDLELAFSFLLCAEEGGELLSNSRPGPLAAALSSMLVAVLFLSQLCLLLPCSTSLTAPGSSSGTALPPWSSALSHLRLIRTLL